MGQKTNFFQSGFLALRPKLFYTYLQFRRENKTFASIWNNWVPRHPTRTIWNGATRNLLEIPSHMLPSTHQVNSKTALSPAEAMGKSNYYQYSLREEQKHISHREMSAVLCFALLSAKYTFKFTDGSVVFTEGPIPMSIPTDSEGHSR